MASSALWGCAVSRDDRLYPIAAGLFAAAEATLGVLVHTVKGCLVPWVSYAAVLLAFGFCLLSARRSAVFLLTALALLFTLAADYILVLHPEHSTLLAMLFFLSVQLLYGARLLLGAAARRLSLLLRAALSVLALLLPLLVVGERADALALVSMLYFANLLTNAALALGDLRRSPMLALGLLFFVLCDVFVGFGMLGEYLPVAEGTLWAWMAAPPINMAWVFYVPALTLLSLSAFEELLS